ncbi:MAG: TolC family protein [Sphingobacteriales bacterium]
MKKRLFGILLSIVTIPALAQDHLSEYIDTGLANNQVLKEKNISLEQSLLMLKNAKSFFLPVLTFNTDYLSAQGGRSIDLPLSDLLNKVYSTLNQLTSSQKFSQVKDINQQFLPNNFYDARFHISYPLLNTDLYYNKKISDQGVVMAEYETDIYREQLRKEIKQAYFSYCSSLDAVSIYRNALQLVGQNLKVSRSLKENGKGLPANILRAESEQQNVAARIIEAENARVTARNYLNFLINRPLTDSVIAEPHALPDSVVKVLATDPNTGDRSELHQLNTGIEISATVIRQNQSFFIPKVNTYLDLGSQASNFEFGSHSRYYLFGAQLSVPIFSGGRNRNNIKLAQLQRSSLVEQKDQLSKQLQVAAISARNNLISAMAEARTTELQLTAAGAYFNLIDKGYKEGSNSLIEFIDARNQLTDSSLKLNIARYNVLIQLAEYERQTATSKVKGK